jgi:hypothetical protein
MINLAFALFGTIILFGIVTTAVRSQPLDRLLYATVGVALVLYCALRPIGSDQDSVAYEVYYFLDDYNRLQVAEPTFNIISNIAEFISAPNGLLLVFFIYAIPAVWIKFYAIRKLSDVPWLALATYFGTYFLLHEFTQIRAAVASGLLLISILYIYQRKLVPYLLCIAAASLFHYSALAAIPLYWIVYGGMTTPIRVLIGLTVPLGLAFDLAQIDWVGLIPIELVRSKLQVYQEVEALRDVKLNVFNAVYLVKYALLYVFLFYSKRLERHSPYFPILLKIYAVSLFAYTALSFNSAFAMRISELFGVVEIILIPLLVYLFRLRILGVLAVISLSAGYLALGIYQTELIQVVR